MHLRMYFAKYFEFYFLYILKIEIKQKLHKTYSYYKNLFKAILLDKTYVFYFY